jgi:hypothetical protein
MKTLLCSLLLLSVATGVNAQVIYGETWQDTITRRQLQEQLDDIQRQQSTESLQRRMQHEEEKGQLDDLRRRLDSGADNSDGR